MRKISNTTELQSELRRLLEYVQSERPSRRRIAGELDAMARRLVTAAGDSLFEAKSDWALKLAESMAKRFSSYGGWHRQEVKAHIHKSQDGVNCELVSALGWTCTIRIHVEMQEIDAYFSLNDRKPSMSDEIDLSELLKHVEEGSKTFKIKDRDPMEDMVMDVSLWLSKHVPNV